MRHPQGLLGFRGPKSSGHSAGIGETGLWRSIGLWRPSVSSACPSSSLVTVTVRFCRVLRAMYRQVSHQLVDGVGGGLAG
jgi:hypothetical protein